MPKPTRGSAGQGGTRRKGNDDTPALVRNRRLIGISPDGQPVNNVTGSNRFDVDANDPHLKIQLVGEDLKTDMGCVYIPRTRERPDAVTYKGYYYEVYETRLEIPIYKLAFVARGYQLPEKDT